MHYEQLVTKMRVHCVISIVLPLDLYTVHLVMGVFCVKTMSVQIRTNSHWKSFVYGFEKSYPIPFNRQKQLSKSALTMDRSAALFKSQHLCQV